MCLKMYTYINVQKYFYPGKGAFLGVVQSREIFDLYILNCDKIVLLF